MKSARSRLKTTAMALATAAVLSTAPVLAAQNTQAQTENPSFFAMAGDLVIARPLMLVTTAVGGVLYVVSSPFAALGGNIKQTGKTLVADPFNATFRRCLGCAFPSEEGL